MNTAEKNEMIGEFADGFQNSVASFVVAYQGTKCADLTRLRRKLRPVGAKLEIVKNTLARRALGEGQNLEGLLTGPTAVIWAKVEPVAPAKVIADFVKDVETFKVKGGLVDGKVVDAAAIHELAKLPSKEELWAKLLSLINAPATRLLQTINAPASQLVNVLDAWKKKLEENGETPAA